MEWKKELHDIDIKLDKIRRLKQQNAKMGITRIFVSLYFSILRENNAYR